MESLSESVDSLRNLFQQAEEAVDSLLQHQRNGNGCKDNNVVAALSLLDEFMELRRMYDASCQEVKQLQQDTKNTEDLLANSLLPYCRLLATVSQNDCLSAAVSDLAASVEGENVACDNNMVPRSLQQLVPYMDPTPISSAARLSVGRHTQASTNRGTPSCNRQVIPRHKYTFTDISEAEFNSVSDFVRLTTRLGEVNQTYQVLWSHFRENPDSEPLTTRAMTDLGLRVAGTTGKAKLQVLKALRLITCDKDFSVTGVN